MKSCGFYSFTDQFHDGINKCSLKSEERPLVVNCAGLHKCNTAFTTHNKDGRLDYYLMYIVSGSLVCFDESSQTVLMPGNTVVFSPKYRYKYTYNGCEPLEYLWLHFTGSQVLDILNELEISLFPSINTASVENNHVHQCFQSIFNAYSRHDKYRNRELSALFERLLVSIARAIHKDGNACSNISRSLNYINSSYGSRICIPELAKMENLSVSRYNFIFKKYMGISPSAYILKLRMNCAHDLLRNTDLSIKQIGISCGYEDSHFFSKVFKSYFGQSPINYRKKTL